MRKLCGLLAIFLLLFLLPAGAEGSRPMAEVVFLPGGKADAAIIMTKNSTVLIDAGTNKMGKGIVAFLKERGIGRVDVLFITHFDKDHVGGADQVLNALPVDLVIEPDYEKESRQRSQYLAALAASPDTRLETLSKNVDLDLDGLHYDIDVANAAFYGEDEENDFSLVIRMIAGEASFLFAGDAESMRLAELMREGNLKSDLLKVPHHGRIDKLSAAFFRAVGARYAVITSDEKNPEDASVLSLLHGLGTEVYLTRRGKVTALTDGKNIEMRQEKP